MPLNPTWLFTHAITIHHYQADSFGERATPIPATTSVTGRFQHDSRMVKNSEGIEVQSVAAVFLPGTTTLNPLDEIEYLGATYRIVSITKPRFESDTPAYIEARVQ